MKFHKSRASLFIPDGSPETTALSRTSHLSIVAHQDDLEILALHGINHCYQVEDKWFTGVVVTDGVGSPKSGQYEKHSAEEMFFTRKKEQEKAAVIGEYSSLMQLSYPSPEVKKKKSEEVVTELEDILRATLPKVVYLHNLADKHDTHVATCLHSLEAIRRLPETLRPQKVYGVEVWRDLDWMPDSLKEVLDVSGYPHLSSALLSVFTSQIDGGKRYDLATDGRRLANATFFESHQTDSSTALNFAMDLTPLIHQLEYSPQTFIQEIMRKFQGDVMQRLEKFI